MGLGQSWAPCGASAALHSPVHSLLGEGPSMPRWQAFAGSACAPQALLLQLEGLFREAEPLYRRALAGLEDALGPAVGLAHAPPSHPSGCLSQRSCCILVGQSSGSCDIGDRLRAVDAELHRRPAHSRVWSWAYFG